MSSMLNKHQRSILSFLLGLFIFTHISAQECQPPSSNIIAWWAFDETSGITAEDRIGDNIGGYTGTPEPTDGQVEGALRFDGSDYVSVADNDLWAFGENNFTIELWANFDAPGGGSIGHPGDIFIGNDEGPGTRNKWFFALGGGFLNFHINGPSVGSRFFPLVPFSPNVDQWYHLAITRNGSTYTIFIDGIPSGSATDNRIIPNANAPLTIGQAEQLGFMNGRLDEVTIYNRALTNGEIQAIFEKGSAGKCIDFTVRPNKGGDTGNVSVKIFGNQFTESATAKLMKEGEPDIIGDPISIGGTGTIISTTFDLTGKTQGLWDVLVENPDGITITLEEGFIIEEGLAPAISVDIVGLPVIRAQRVQTYWTFISNSGNVDGVFPGQTLLLSAGVFSADDSNMLVSSRVSSLGSTARSTQEECDAVKNAIESLKDEIKELEERKRDLEEARDATDDPAKKREFTAEIGRLFSKIGVKKHTLRVFQEWFDKNCPPKPNPEPNPEPITDPVIPVQPPIIDILPVMVPQFGCYVITVSITPVLTPMATPIVTIPRGIREVATAAILPTSGVTAEKEICTIASFDPNDKVGLIGIGEKRYISGRKALNYTVFFENLDSATASAQEVIITDQLDTVNMDLSSLSLGPISFGDTIVTPSAGVSEFNTDIDLRPDNDLFVRVDVDLNQNTGILTWRFTSLDPETGELPDDPLAGFLPPNINPPEGDGSVLFTVMPKEDLPTGTEIRNSARIIFDTNEPINTPEWFNTIDNNKPESDVSPLAATQTSAGFAVQWSGTDEGAGIKDFTIFVSENGTPFTPWLTNVIDTSGTFQGENGKSYGFYSVVRDQTDNIEEAPLIADTTTTVLIDGISQCKLDVDGDTNVDALTDGLLFIRHMFGIRGESLVENAAASDCTKCTAAELEPIVEQCDTEGTSDIDGNGQVDALTDGLLIIRYLFGIRGDALINNSVSDGCTRCSPIEIEAYLQGLIP